MFVHVFLYIFADTYKILHIYIYIQYAAQQRLFLLDKQCHDGNEG